MDNEQIEGGISMKTQRPEDEIVYENFTGTKKEHDFWNNLFKWFKRSK